MATFINDLRYALPPAAQVARIYGDSGADAGARHRRNHRHLHVGSRCSASVVARGQSVTAVSHRGSGFLLRLGFIRTGQREHVHLPL